MTTLAGGPPEAGQTRVLGRADASADRDVPVRAEGTLLYGAQPGSGYVRPPALVRRSDGQVLQLTPLLYAVLDAIDGRRDAEQVAAVVTDTTGRELQADDVCTLVEDKLRPLGLVCMADGSVCDLKKANPLLALRPRVVVSNPELTRRITAPFAVLFNPAVVVVATALFVGVAGWVLFSKGLASAAHDAFTDPGLLLTVFAITVVSAGFHEFGHAAALRRGGGTPGAMGAGFYLVWPAFYTDVTDAYRLGRGSRLRTDLGGLYFNALVAVVMFGVWALTDWDGLLLVIAAQLLQMVRQLPPTVRYDGYHILADATGVPDLFHRIGPTVRSFLPRRWRSGQADELKLWARVVVTAWVVVVVPLLLLTALVSVLTLPRIVGTTLHAVSQRADLVGAQAHDGAWASAAVEVLAIAALVVPVAGIIYMLVRSARRYGVRTWRRTQGRPVQRGIATVVMLALLGGLAYAWWPREGVYAPIEPWERGTLQDAVSASFAQPLLPGSGLRAGETRSVNTVWPSDVDALPTRDQPMLALVLSPRGGTDLGDGTIRTDDGTVAPTWVFPFTQPDPPGPGDNQALAVVTKDGTTDYDVAFALVWVDGSTTADNSNEAYALASCEGCKAVAVSFQVVLVIGQDDAVAPQNVAAAVSYNCVSCLTEALAVQLVLTLPDGLDEDAYTALTQLWAEIAAFGQNLEGLSFDEIRAQLASYEEQIIAIVQPDLATSTTTQTGATPSASTVVSSTATAEATVSASPSDSSAPTTSDTPSASPTGTASPEPTATATADPTVSATP